MQGNREGLLNTYPGLTGSHETMLWTEEYQLPILYNI